MNHPQIRALSVTTTAQQVLKPNKKRKFVSIQNEGSADVTLLDQQNQPAAQGKPIPPGAEWYQDHFNGQGEYWIIGTGTDDVRIEEVIT